LRQSINQSINQSKHISIAPYVASESEAPFSETLCFLSLPCFSLLLNSRVHQIPTTV